MSRTTLKQLMEPYPNLSRESGIEAYELGADFIRVQFRNGHIYRYTYEIAGRENVEKMKQLALAGRGLATFISQNEGVRRGYASRE